MNQGLANFQFSDLTGNVFCDWLSIAQTHSEAVPILNDGVICEYDGDGVKLSERMKRVWLESSFETGILVRSDGHRVELSGNIGRLGREENIFGWRPLECVARANALMDRLGLPRFTRGQRYWSQQSGSICTTGATISKLDATVNLVAGSQIHAERFLHFCGGLRVGRTAPQPYGLQGCAWGLASDWLCTKMYGKGAELLKRAKPGTPAYERGRWALDIGLVRAEVSMRRKYLDRHGGRFLDEWADDDRETKVIAAQTDFLHRDSISANEYEEIPGRAGEIAIAWRDGVNLRRRLSRNTFYKYRRILRGYGIDIAERCDVTRLPLKVEIIKLSVLPRPIDYMLGQPELLPELKVA